MSTTEKELKQAEGTCTTSQCSTTDKEKKAVELKEAQAALAAEKAKKEKGGCCGG